MQVKDTFWKNKIYFLILALSLLLTSCSVNFMSTQTTSEPINLDKKFVVENYTYQEKIEGYARDLLQSNEDISDRISLTKSAESKEKYSTLSHSVIPHYEYDEEFWITTGQNVSPYFGVIYDNPTCISSYDFQLGKNACRHNFTDFDNDGISQHNINPANSKYLRIMIELAESGNLSPYYNQWSCNNSGGSWAQDGKDCKYYCTGWVRAIYYKVYSKIFKNHPAGYNYQDVITTRGSGSEVAKNMCQAFPDFFKCYKVYTSNPEEFIMTATSGTIFSANASFNHVSFIEGVDRNEGVVFISEGAMLYGQGARGVYMHAGYYALNFLKTNHCGNGCTIAVPTSEIAPYPKSVLNCSFVSVKVCSTVRLKDVSTNNQGTGSTDSDGDLNNSTWKYNGIIY